MRSIKKKAIFFWGALTAAILFFSYIEVADYNQLASESNSSTHPDLSPRIRNKGINGSAKQEIVISHKELSNSQKPEEYIAFTNATSSIPAEWESRVLEAFTNHPTHEEDRNTSLKHLVIVEACNVPAVQDVCLQHLVIGLSDNPTEFIQLITNQAIPLNLRLSFFKKALDTRSPDLCTAIAGSMSSNSDYSLKNIASGYLDSHR